jgi:hypothetical protein
MRGAAVWLVLLTLAGAAPAQQARTVVHLPLRDAELSIAPDTVSGLLVIFEPALVAREGRSTERAFVLRFEPDSAMDWLNSAVVALRQPIATGPAEGVQWSRTLVPIGGTGAIALGRSRKKGALQRAHWLAIADSGVGWRIELKETQADTLLRLILAFGSQSRIDTSAAAPRESNRVDVEAAVEHQPAPRPLATAGRAVVQFVVAPDGSAEPGSFVLLTTTDPGLMVEAWEIIRTTRFRAAVRDGAPVRQLVRQSIAWPGAR